MARVFNFSAGPSVLPEVVLKQAADEMLDYKGSGMSVMEMSHRSKVYDNIIKEAEKVLRDLIDIPDNYKVLFLQGGASQQFAAIPMNLMKNGVADYIITGQWAKKACEEAKKYGKVNVVASSADKTFSYVLVTDPSDISIKAIDDDTTKYILDGAYALNEDGKLDEKTEDDIKGMCAGSENYGNFFAQNCFMGSSGTLLIVSTLTEQGYPVDALQIAGQSVPIAVFAVIVGVIYALIFDQILKRRFSDRKKQEEM